MERLLRKKFTEIKLLLDDIENDIEKIEKRKLTIAELRFEFEEHEKYHKNKKS